uniref:Uncharacterized protein n=1 Tax=Meloidogyne hapla TaxID=6305 RepID=A0A1I8BRT0_MELHA
MQPRHFDANKKQFITEEGHCNCISNGPSISNIGGKNTSSIEESNENTQKCKVLDIPSGRNKEIIEPKLEKNEAVYRLCYSSALRMLPVLKATNEIVEGQSVPAVLVTIEQFWNDKYWQILKPYDLHLYYVFPVTQRDYCENGDITIPDTRDLIWMNGGKASTAGMPWLCKTRLKIQMEDDPEDYHSNYEYQENIDPRMPQEVQFERNVFAGAERVRVYYEVIIIRENQLKAGAGKPKFEERRTYVKSDALDFELHPEIHGTGMEDYLRSQSAAHGNIGNNKNESDNIEQNKKINGNKLNEKDKDKYEMHLPIVRPILKTKGREKSIEKAKSNGFTRTIEITPQVSVKEDNSEVEATTLVPVPSPKNELGKIETVQQHQSSPSQPAGTSLTSNSPQTQMSSTSTHFTTDSKIKEADSKILSESENKEIKEEKDQDWILFRNVLIAFLVLLFIVVLLGIFYNRSLCCFSGSKRRENINGHQQMNGKTKIQNGKEYKEACNNYP